MHDVNVEEFDFEIDILNLSKEDYDSTVKFLLDTINENPMYKDLNGITDYSSEPQLFKHVLITSIFLKPFYEFNLEFDLNNDDHIKLIDIIKTDPKNVIRDAFNHIIKIFNNVDLSELNLCISKILQTISDISAIFNKTFGNSISIQNIIQLADENPEFDELLYFDIPDNLQFNEIEEIISQKVKRTVEIISQSDTVLANFVNCGSAVNVKQLGQSIVNVGLKPDLFGKVLSEPINTSFLRGLRSVKDFYINAIGARKALITNFRQVRKSGYLARKIALLVLPHNIRPDLDDCKTKYYVNKTIPDEKTYTFLLGRYLSDGTLLTPELMSNYVGSTVKLRSPITCADATHVCAKCYGSLHKVNKNLHAGLIGMLLLTEELIQRLLSSKHLLQTNTDKIIWSEEFDEYFYVDKSAILPNVAVDRIMINVDDIEQDEILGLKYVNKFRVKVQTKNTVINISSPVNLYLNEELEELVGTLNSEEIRYEIKDAETPIFQMIVDNNELSASLFEIISLIEKTDHLGCHTIDDITNRFSDLIQESGLKTNNIHTEMIIRALVRKDSTSIDRPNFKAPKFPEYFIQTVSNGILNSPLSISLVFEKIKKQMTDLSTFEKTEESVLDRLFLKFLDEDINESIHQ